jgi:hypothetical protein
MPSNCTTCGEPIPESATSCLTCGAAAPEAFWAEVGANGFGPGYVVKVDTPVLPSAGPLPRLPVRVSSAAVSRPGIKGLQAVSVNHCLNCRREREGKFYFFTVRRRQEAAAILQEESGFICNKCARRHLGLDPLDLWAKILIGAFLGLFGILLLLRLRLLFLPIAVLLITVGYLGRLFRRLRYCQQELYLYDSTATCRVTQLAIRLRKVEIAQSLHQLESDVIFVAGPRVG